MSEETREDVGERIGRLLAPCVASISRARKARMFHPDGRTFVARVEAIETESTLACVGAALEGSAIARFSGALWRRGFEHLDVLGAALRFRREPITDALARPGDQDLLFATIRSPFTMPFSPLTTDAHDFMANRYWAVSPFDAPGAGRVKFRLSPHDSPAPASARLRREDRLESLVVSGPVSWAIEARRTFTMPWTAVARLLLEEVASIDQATLRFSPFHCGRGIVPRGLVHAMRRPTYAASQAARPEASPPG